VLARSYRRHPDALVFQIGDPADGVVPQQLEAPDMRACDDGKRLAGLQGHDQRRRLPTG
jgi:hypothetical protein